MTNQYSQPIVIRDLRRKEKFQMDDEYLNGQARICGYKASLVYMSLCRHANFHTQESFPSIDLMAKELGVERKTIMRGLQSLLRHNVVAIKKHRSKEGTWKNNTYTLLDRTLWISHQVPVGDTAPSPLQSKNQVPVGDSKVTKREGYIYQKENKKAKELDELRKQLLKAKTITH